MPGCKIAIQSWKGNLHRKTFCRMRVRPITPSLSGNTLIGIKRFGSTGSYVSCCVASPDLLCQLMKRCHGELVTISLCSQGSSVSLEDLDLFKASQTTLPQELKPKCKRRPLDEPLVADVKKNKELAKLQLYGSTFAFTCFDIMFFLMLCFSIFRQEDSKFCELWSH